MKTIIARDLTGLRASALAAGRGQALCR